MDKINILYIIDYFAQMAGAERNVFEIVTRLNPQGYNPIVVCLKGGSLAELLRSKGIEVTDLKLNKIYSLDAFINAIKLFKLIKQKNVKIVVTYHESSDIWGGLIAKFAGVPVIISSRRDMGYKLKKTHFLAYKFINNLLFDKIITVSEAVKNILIKRQNAPEKKLITIYNGVNLEKFFMHANNNKIRESLGLNPKSPVVGILAALRPIKGHKYFLEAASIILKSIPDAQFLIVGWNDEINYFSEIKNFAKSLGVSQNVIFTGGRSDIEEMLSIMDVSVISSLSEGFSNTILETSAAGKPIVATNCGGNPEAIINGETGFLVPPKNAEALAEAISNLLRNKELSKKMGLAAKNRVRDIFSFERMMINIEEVYELLLEEKALKIKKAIAKLKYSVRVAFLKFIKVNLSGLLYYSGAAYLKRQLFSRLSKNNNLTILAYHKINNDFPNYLGLNTKVSSFEKQMKYIKQYYNLISLDKAVHLIQGGENFPKNTVVITFDDGYRDNYINAFPIIKKFNIPVTIFLTAGSINTGKSLWFDAIITLIKETYKKTLDISHFGLKKYIINSSEGKGNAISEIVNYVKTANVREREELIKFMSEELEVNIDRARPYSQLLSWEEINEMKANGVDFGAHSMTHSILTKLPLREVEYEICESKRIIENRIAQKVLAFAYPNGLNGDFDKEAINMLKNNGFNCACTLINGVNNTNLFTLRRKNIYEGMTAGIYGSFSKSLFATEMSGIFDFLRKKGNSIY